MARWAGYTRVSRVGDREETLISPEIQADRIREYARGRRLKVEMLEPELDVSGGRTERPILGAAIDAVEQGRYAGIIVAQLDRLSRMSLADALKTIERIENAGGQVIAVAESFDASTPEGRMGRNVFLSMADMQLGRYKAQFAESKRRAVERGIWPTNTAPIGYTVTRRKDGGTGQLEPDPKKRATVLQAFEARAAGTPWSAIGKTIGCGTSTARKIVTNRVYLGEVRLSEWVNPAAHPPLVSRELFEAAQLHHPRPPRNSDARPALLTGLVRCAGCQGAMTPSSSMKKGGLERIYRCMPNNKANGRCSEPAIISQRKLDTYVEAVALTEIERLAITAQERTREIEVALEALSAADAELEAFQKVARVSELGAETFAAGMRSRAEAVEEARRAVANARLLAGPLPEPQTLRELWPDLSIEDRRHVLRGALGAIYVRRGRGPASERVRLVAAGFGPRNGFHTRLALDPIAWDVDLPGEIRAAAAQHVE